MGNRCFWNTLDSFLTFTSAGLAAYLRMLGFDTWYDRFADDPELAAVPCQQRVLLTRDVGLLKRREVDDRLLCTLRQAARSVAGSVAAVCTGRPHHSFQPVHGLQRALRPVRKDESPIYCRRTRARRKTSSAGARMRQDLLARLSSCADVGWIAS